MGYRQLVVFLGAARVGFFLRKRRNVSYQALSVSLKAIEVDELAENIANKISRGKFTAVFLLQCLEAVGCKALRFDDA